MMANKNKLFFSEKIQRWLFICPGCDGIHDFDATWTFSGNLERPTVSPSLLVKSRIRCHLFVRDGQIQYLDDCDHDLKGQTVDIPVWDKVGDY